VTEASEQGQYQVRFDWGRDGAKAIGVDADVLVLVDLLGESPELAGSLEATAGVVIAGSLRNCAAVARWAVQRQAQKGDRFTVAVVAVGDTVAAGETREAATRFALEDLLGAGAIIDALADVGIDYCSPEAAAAAAAFTGLRNATGHLIGASVGGRAATARGERSVIEAQIDINSSHDVPILREFSFGA
jgi:phosphosulfolactate phosphohydrolase-like enzyme